MFLDRRHLFTFSCSDLQLVILGAGCVAGLPAEYHLQPGSEYSVRGRKRNQDRQNWTILGNLVSCVASSFCRGPAPCNVEQLSLLADVLKPMAICRTQQVNDHHTYLQALVATLEAIIAVLVRPHEHHARAAYTDGVRKPSVGTFSFFVDMGDPYHFFELWRIALRQNLGA